MTDRIIATTTTTAATATTFNAAAAKNQNNSNSNEDSDHSIDIDIDIMQSINHRNTTTSLSPGAVPTSSQLPTSPPQTTTTTSASSPPSTGTGSGICGASSNLMNSIVGAGIIGIPYALRQSGIVMGIFLLALVAYLTDKSLRMLMDCALFHPSLLVHSSSTASSRSSTTPNLTPAPTPHRTSTHHIHTFEDLMRIPFGIVGYRFILAGMFIMAYGAMIAYLIIIKDTIPKVLGFNENNDSNNNTNTVWGKELIMTVSSFCIILPLALLRDMSMLSCTSAISVLADAALVVIIIVFSPVTSTIQEYDGGFFQIVQDYWICPQLFIGLGVLSTAMACQHSAFLISGSLSNITPHRWSIVTFRSISAATIMTLLLGVFGFVGYLAQTKGNVLNNFPEQSIAINSGRALLGITMYLTYPMESLVARHVVIQFFYQGNMDNTTVNSRGEVQPEHNAWCCGYIGRRAFVTILLFVASLIPALLVDDLGPVLSITGSLGASCIAYIAPGLVYLGINGGHFLQWVDGKTEEHSDETVKGTELPVVGDATARMPSPLSSTTTTGMTASGTNTVQQRSRRRPLWWYFVGMPLWIAIAKRGERGTREYMMEQNSQYQINHSHSGDDDDYHDNDGDFRGGTERSTRIVQPNHRDYCISIFMILFGILAAICGVVSNVYVEIHDIFFTPQ
jgi:solute carrier family 38 (sodium-coupled neutral amino acid transporter), member 11